MGTLRYAAEALLAGVPESCMQPMFCELVVILRLPNVLHSPALIVPHAVALPPSCVVPGTAACHPPGPLTPVPAAQGGKGEGQGQADGEEGQCLLPPGPICG